MKKLKTKPKMHLDKSVGIMNSFIDEVTSKLGLEWWAFNQMQEGDGLKKKEQDRAIMREAMLYFKISEKPVLV